MERKQASTREEQAGSRTGWVGPLDGVRGLAAAAVLAVHVMQLTGYHRFSGVGSIAVDVFMMVSGFLMMFHFHQRRDQEPWERPSTWMLFWTRRFFRIAPLYYFLLIPTFFLIPEYSQWRGAIDERFGLRVREYGSATWDNVIAHASFAFGALPTYCFATPLPDWSIGLEMQFYLCFPLLAVLLLRLPRTVFAAGTIAIVFAAERWSAFPMPSFLPLKLAEFVAGMLLGMAHTRSISDGCRFTELLLAIMLLLATSEPAVVGCGVLLAALLLTNEVETKSALGWLQRMLSSPVATSSAEMSYAVYLTHLLVAIPLIAWLSRYSWYAEASPILRVLVTLPLVALPTYGLAILLHWGVEKPGIRAGKAAISVFARRRSPVADRPTTAGLGVGMN